MYYSPGDGNQQREPPVSESAAITTGMRAKADTRYLEKRANGQLRPQQTLYLKRAPLTLSPPPPPPPPTHRFQDFPSSSLVNRYGTVHFSQAPKAALVAEEARLHPQLSNRLSSSDERIKCLYL